MSASDHGGQVIRLRKFRISGFKALDGATFHIPDRALLLIGANGSGKSSVLQALALVREFAQGNVSKFFDDRNWNSDGVRTKLEGPRAATFRADLLLEHGAGDRYLWQFNFGLRSHLNLRETLWHLPSGATAPSIKINHGRRKTTFRLDETKTLGGLRLPGSVLAFYDLDAPGQQEVALQHVMNWAGEITSLELLSPNAMRRGARGSTKDIGPRGERLTSFLANLSATAKSNLVRRLSRFYPIEQIETTRKRAGWVDMRIAESFSDVGGVGPVHASDGLLRLLALCAIPEFGDSASLVLLDEIEDGVEPHTLPDIVGNIVSECHSQFIFTSHSPLLINSFRSAEIQVLTRRPTGSVATSRFGDLDCWGEGIEYFGPGELWSMAERDALQERILGRPTSPPTDTRASTSRFSQAFARQFMSAAVP